MKKHVVMEPASLDDVSIESEEEEEEEEVDWSTSQN